jgi:hypothetical protein
VPETPPKIPDFVNWPSFPFEGELRIKPLEETVAAEPPRDGEEEGSCDACGTPDDSYIWVNERWRVRAMDHPSGLPMVLILESRSHLDLGDLPNLLAAELGVMTVRLERAIRSLDQVARVHVNRWGDGAAHLHVWFMARPVGRLQLRGSFLSMWDDILPPVDEATWRENLALIAAWLAEFGGRSFAEPPRIDWQAPATLAASQEAERAREAATSEAAARSSAARTEPAEGQAIAAREEGVGQPGAARATTGSVPARDVMTSASNGRDAEGGAAPVGDQVPPAVGPVEIPVQQGPANREAVPDSRAGDTAQAPAEV